MVLIKLGYDPKQKFNWRVLDKSYSNTHYNGKLVVVFHERLWKKVQSTMKIRKKGFDSIILIDGKRRSGKSTLAQSISYLLDPNITIDNYVAGMEHVVEKIDKAKEGSPLIFDEGSLVVSSKDALNKQNKQLHKIIDVVGQKKLTLIFCMPTFFNISRDIAITHSLFLIHVYVDKQLNRGRFAYFGTKQKKMLYEIGKKHMGSYAKPKAKWNGRFEDFKLPFNDEYLQLKKKSLMEALDPELAKKNKKKVPTESEIKTQFLVKFKENCPDVTDKILSKGFGISTREYYRRKATVSPEQ